MKPAALFGLVALLPAALNSAPATARGMVVPLCTGDGVARTLTLPLAPNELPGKEAPGCCAKGCHTGSRKKALARQSGDSPV